jgi:hypothetical protein
LTDHSKLVLIVSPSAKCGDNITAVIDAVNVPETVVELSAPDTVVISQPHREVVGTDTFKITKTWTVQHVQKDTSGVVQITASADGFVQTGLCKIIC